MSVFVTGASGMDRLRRRPRAHRRRPGVVGWPARRASAAALTAAGAKVLRGTLDDLDSLRSAAAGSDGVIHSRSSTTSPSRGLPGRPPTRIARAIETLGEAPGSDRPFVIASGTPRGRTGASRYRTGRARSDPGAPP